MVSAAQPNFVHPYFVKLTEWTDKHKREAMITAVACAALGIACAIVVAKVTLVTAAAIALISTAVVAFSVSAALFLSYCANHNKNIPVEVLQALAPQEPIDRVAIMHQTLQDLKNGYYINPYGIRINIETADSVNQAYYIHDGGPKEQRQIAQLQPPGFLTPITVTPKDCLEVAEELCKQGLSPMVLDMANAFHPGGNYLGGARSQEEDICRRSGLSIAIDPKQGIQHEPFFPLNAKEHPYSGIYVPKVPVFRAGADKHYAYLDNVFNVDIGVVAAPCRPPLQNVNGRLRINDADAVIMRERIRTILHMAHLNNKNAVVLGAFGCGAFYNPPEHVAEIFNEVIQEEFVHCFDKIVFAILKDGNDGRAHNPEGNYLPFKRQFAD